MSTKQNKYINPIIWCVRDRGGERYGVLDLTIFPPYSWKSFLCLKIYTPSIPI